MRSKPQSGNFPAFDLPPESPNLVPDLDRGPRAAVREHHRREGTIAGKEQFVGQMACRVGAEGPPLVGPRLQLYGSVLPHEPHDNLILNSPARYGMEPSSGAQEANDTPEATAASTRFF